MLRAQGAKFLREQFALSSARIKDILQSGYSNRIFKCPSHPQRGESACRGSRDALAFAEQRCQCPALDLADLAKLDDRVEAHLDGLRIAGDEGWALCEEQLAVNEVGEVFAAGVLAFESRNQEWIEKVLSVVEEDTNLGSGLISALGWLTFDQAQPLLGYLLEMENPVRQWIGIGGAAVHRGNPGEMLAKALLSEHPLLRTRAMKGSSSF